MEVQQRPDELVESSMGSDGSAQPPGMTETCLLTIQFYNNRFLDCRVLEIIIIIPTTD